MWKLVSVAATAILCGSALLGQVELNDQGDALSVIDKAVAAAGGEANVAKFKALVVKGSFIGPSEGNGLTYQIQEEAQWPGQFRRQLLSEIPKTNVTSVLNGDNGWFKEPSGTREMSPDVLYFHQERLYTRWVRYRLPLKDPAFTLSLAGKLKIHGEDATGVRVTHKDHPDLVLFFGVQSGLLLKSECLAAINRQGNVENAKLEEFYSDYTDVDGVKVPMKVLERRNGKMVIETTISEAKRLERLDESRFAKP